MKNLILLYSLIIVVSSHAQSGNNYAVNAEPFCLGVTYLANSNVPSASSLDPYNNYSCLATQPNPSWYFVKTIDTGTIDLSLSANQDIDFIVFGPFSSYDSMMYYNGSYGVDPLAPVHDCSYSQTSSETPTISSSAVGEYYLFMISNYANQSQQITLSQTGGLGGLDCSAYTDVAKHFIYGNVFYDFNQNGEKDAFEPNIEGVSVHIDPLGLDQFNSMQTGYQTIVDTNLTTNYYISFNGLVNWSLTSSNSYNFVLDSVNNLADSIDFGVYPDTFFVDGNIDLSASSIQCILNSNLFITLENHGTISPLINYSLELPSDFSYLNSDLSEDSISGQVVYFSGITSSALQSTSFNINLSTSGNLFAGDTVCFYSMAEYMDTSNNNLLQMIQDTVCFVVECSYDPNDKTAFVGGFHQQEIVDTNEFIAYLINFENTGNAPAVNIEILDYLPGNLDINTFQFISSSHPAQYSIDSNRRLKINYDQIILPFTQPESKGYFKFRIKPVTAVVPNEQIFNSAEIYFDFNPPIYTDTAKNTISCFITPGHPNLLFDGLGLISSGVNLLPEDTVKWYLNGQLLPGLVGSELNIGTNGIYTMEIINQFGCSTIDSINVSDLSLDENVLDQFIIYPNPAKDKFIVSFESSKPREIKLIDIKGRVIYFSKGNSNQVEINVVSLDAGTYLLRIESENGIIQEEKVIKL